MCPKWLLVLDTTCFFVIVKLHEFLHMIFIPSDIVENKRDDDPRQRRSYKGEDIWN
jgi:hypothetical protein